ncbi:saccharopine dehydrogenase family protein [Variovorax ginsengisoli]|uniref:Saccharopine dehydrogenase NADP-binding domain-containing protein n=1 Tax=Variovorax ginsengisoli TaxID=363844 RepID=A0ABT8S8X4_9BURK|nr:saccharopine dehydrogenase NADP-binding domain-containing protein [Variovorax ginsengisoli]MDN8616190.1 saccharopine dehydrogenase NADP-binding domain-containing protein [Variovorax ginsengisoli]MDO1535360.1 saccharopine dehydrogenase NADP-binding domain-containing protein [Variovorax ginsengisoli]
MNPAAEFDIIVFGASGYIGRLVAEHYARHYGVGGKVKWAIAGRSQAKLAEVRDQLGAPKDMPLVEANANDPAQLASMIARTKAIVSTVGPYQFYGSNLVAACAAAGVDYLDLCGEPAWIRQMIDTHEATAKASGARILFSCGFDSLVFELGVYYAQETAKATLGAPAPHVKARLRAMQGGPSGGSVASVMATMAAVQNDAVQRAVFMSPFGLTPGFEGPTQPQGDAVRDDPDVGPVGPFIMAALDTKNVHRSNLLMGHPYGRDFLYDEMVVGGGEIPSVGDMSLLPKPGEGPTKDEREAGFYDILFIGIGADGRKVRTSVKGDIDPGYGASSKMLAETAIALMGAPDVPGGIWTPGAALRGSLVERLRRHAGVSFSVEE